MASLNLNAVFPIGKNKLSNNKLTSIEDKVLTIQEKDDEKLRNELIGDYQPARPQGDADDGDVHAARTAAAVVAGALLDLELHVELRRRPGERLGEPRDVLGRGDQHAQDEATPQHDLLDVDDVDGGVGEDRQQGARDPGAVLAGQGHQDGVGRRRRHVHVRERYNHARARAEPERVPVRRGATPRGTPQR